MTRKEVKIELRKIRAAMASIDLEMRTVFLGMKNPALSDHETQKLIALAETSNNRLDELKEKADRLQKLSNEAMN